MIETQTGIDYGSFSYDVVFHPLKPIRVVANRLYIVTALMIVNGVTLEDPRVVKYWTTLIRDRRVARRIARRTGMTFTWRRRTATFKGEPT